MGAVRKLRKNETGAGARRYGENEATYRTNERQSNVRLLAARVRADGRGVCGAVACAAQVRVRP